MAIDYDISPHPIVDTIQFETRSSAGLSPPSQQVGHCPVALLLDNLLPVDAPAEDVFSARLTLRAAADGGEFESVVLRRQLVTDVFWSVGRRTVELVLPSPPPPHALQDVAWYAQFEPAVGPQRTTLSKIADTELADGRVTLTHLPDVAGQILLIQTGTVATDAPGGLHHAPLGFSSSPAAFSVGMYQGFVLPTSAWNGTAPIELTSVLSPNTIPEFIDIGTSPSAFRRPLAIVVHSQEAMSDGNIVLPCGATVRVGLASQSRAELFDESGASFGVSIGTPTEVRPACVASQTSASLTISIQSFVGRATDLYIQEVL